MKNISDLKIWKKMAKRINSNLSSHIFDPLTIFSFYHFYRVF
ncbi:hypothetical protein PRO82_000960 [Candidatus Protochlamydia amoebophila]|nr:hypothetical protein [Candidatus Protochlamydia amoebophila]